MATVASSKETRKLYQQIDRVWYAIAILICGLALLDLKQVLPTIDFTIGALLATAPYILLAVMAIGFLKATGAESVIAKAFQGNEVKMIVFASIVGGLAPFCSCEVIPFIAALLVAGAPLSAVMALWLSSPLMDPSSFFITVGELGLIFAIAKTIFAILIGLAGGFFVRSLKNTGYFTNVLRVDQKPYSPCQSNSSIAEPPVWTFWKDKVRRRTFHLTFVSNGVFLFKWLTLAYLFESLMVHYIPAQTIASFVGGEGVFPIILSAFIGAPAYLNGYAAPAIVSGLIKQGMTPGAAMSFMVAGGITSIPAMTAVFALVNRQVFSTYLFIGIIGAIASGILFNMYLGWLT